MKGAPIRVSEAERDTFIAAFERRLRYAAWSLIPATFLLIGLVVLLIPEADSPSATIAMYMGLTAILVPFVVAYLWAWGAPARELGRRPLAGRARTREEVRQLMFARMTYGQLGFAVLAGLLLVWNASAKTDVFHGWGVLWLGFGGALVAAAALQALRKWMYERH